MKFLHVFKKGIDMCHTLKNCASCVTPCNIKKKYDIRHSHLKFLKSCSYWGLS